MTTPPGAQIGEMLGKLLLKTFYGHTVGEVLALEVALVETVESLIAAELTNGERARTELTELVLSQVGRERELDIFRKLLERRGETGAAIATQCIRDVYRLRDRFAHGALIGDGIGEDGWLLTGRKGSKHPGPPVSPEDVEKVIAQGKNVLNALTEHLTEILHDASAPPDGESGHPSA